MLQAVELGIQRTFAALARASAARPLLISLSTLIVLIGLGFGILNIEVETDVLKLWVDDSTSLIDVRANQHKSHGNPVVRKYFLSISSPPFITKKKKNNNNGLGRGR